MTDILALDIATTTGWARGRVGEEPRCGSIRFSKPGASHNAIFAACLRWFIDLTKSSESRPKIIVIEAPLPSTWLKGKTNKDTNDLLLGLHGIIRAVAFERGIYDIRVARTNDVRSHFIDLSVCARGEAKDMVLRKCRSLGWLETADDDAADACALWSYQVALIDPQQAIRISPLFGRIIPMAQPPPV